MYFQLFAEPLTSIHAENNAMIIKRRRIVCLRKKKKRNCLNEQGRAVLKPENDDKENHRTFPFPEHQTLVLRTTTFAKKSIRSRALTPTAAVGMLRSHASEERKA